MSIEENYDGGHSDDGPEGEVHGLLATAFDDGLPAVNLVPAAVAGYRRYRRRARVLGTTGGALALVGAVVAGTALATGTSGTGSRFTTAPAAGGGAVTGSSTVPAVNVQGCSGSYYRFGQYDGSGVYSADQAGLTDACVQDLTTLQKLTGDTGLLPLTETTKGALAKHDVPAGATPPPGSGPLIQPGFYDGRINGVAYRFSIFVSDKTGVFANDCTPQSCPPNRTLADGRTATELASGGPYSTLVIHYDATHSVMVDAFLTERTTARQVPFDFEKLIASPDFAQLISADVRTLNRLTHPA